MAGHHQKLSALGGAGRVLPGGLGRDHGLCYPDSGLRASLLVVLCYSSPRKESRGEGRFPGAYVRE